MKNLKTIKNLILLSIVFLPFFYNCGYHLSGSGSSLPPGLKTIAIPDFENLSSHPDAQQFISFAIRDEFINRSKLKLEEDISNADLVLEGIIKKFLVTPLIFTDRVSAEMYRVSLFLDVKLIDRLNNKIIYKSSNLRFTDSYDIESADFFTQETATLDEIAKEIAETIVTGILEDF